METTRTIVGCILTDYDLITKLKVELHDENNPNKPLTTSIPIRKLKDILMDKFTNDRFHPIRCELIYQ